MGLSSILYRLSRGWVAILATLAFALFMAFVLPTQAAEAETATGGIGSPDTSFWYTPDQLRSFAEAYGESGRAAYLRARWTFDLIYPLVYGVFFVTTISWCLHASLRQDSTWRLLNLVPFSGMIFDYLENIATSWVMWRFPAPAQVAAFLAPIFTVIKWACISVSFGILLYGFALVLYKRFLRKNAQDPSASP